MDYNIVESEILATAAMCVNDFNYDKKDILLVGVNNAALIHLLSSFDVNIYVLNASVRDEDFAENVAFYDLAINLKINQFDVIIDLQNNNVENYKKLLKNSGILIVDLISLDKSEILTKRAEFNVVMPFKIYEEAVQKYYLFISNKFHPIADLSLQKLDLIENLQYCNERTYNAVYAMPNYIKKSLQGIIKS